MKPDYENKEIQWPSAKVLDDLRQELHARLAREELDYSLRLEAFDRIIDLLRMDPAAFHRLWVQPFLDAGVNLKLAFASIAESYFNPN